MRTFVPYTLGGQQYVLAAYTCTPLVKIPMSDLKPGAQVKGVTIADLGSGNQPLDMVPYRKDGHEYILIANTSAFAGQARPDQRRGVRQVVQPSFEPLRCQLGGFDLPKRRLDVRVDGRAHHRTHGDG